MSSSIRNSSNIVHKTCIKITEWGGVFCPIVTNKASPYIYSFHKTCVKITECIVPNKASQTFIPFIKLSRAILSSVEFSLITDFFSFMCNPAATEATDSCYRSYGQLLQLLQKLRTAATAATEATDTIRWRHTRCNASEMTHLYVHFDNSCSLFSSKNTCRNISI